MGELQFHELDRANHDEVRDLILDGLRDHWGELDESLNPDLRDMLTSYAGGRTLTARDRHGQLRGTGTIMPRPNATAEIVRMSVASAARRQGVGRAIVEELVTTATQWGSTKVVLETGTDWAEGVAFYQTCGFVITHLEDGEFGSNTWFERLI